MANKFGVKNALAAVQAQAKVHGFSGFTVSGWLSHHVDHLTGVDLNTVAKYRAYIANDVDDVFGSIPRPALSREHVVQWIKRMLRESRDPTSSVSASKAAAPRVCDAPRWPG